MPDDSPKPTPKPPSREAVSAAKLRENLARRKQQARARAATDDNQEP